MAPEPLSDAITALSQFLIADASLGDTLQRVADITHQAVPSAEFVAITMLDEAGEPATTIFTDESAPEIGAVRERARSVPRRVAAQEDRQAG